MYLILFTSILLCVKSFVNSVFDRYYVLFYQCKWSFFYPNFIPLCTFICVTIYLYILPTYLPIYFCPLYLSTYHPSTYLFIVSECIYVLFIQSTRFFILIEFLNENVKFSFYRGESDYSFRFILFQSKRRRGKIKQFLLSLNCPLILLKWIFMRTIFVFNHIGKIFLLLYFVVVIFTNTRYYAIKYFR